MKGFSGCFLMLFLLLLNAGETWQTASQWATESWPLVPATIVRSSLYHGGASSEAKVCYRYQAAGRTRYGRTVRSDAAFQNKRWAQAVVEQNPPGAEVQVALNPKDPDDAVLLPGKHRNDLYRLLALLLWNTPLLAGWLYARDVVGTSTGYPETRVGGRRCLHFRFFPPLAAAVLALMTLLVPVSLLGLALENLTPLAPWLVCAALTAGSVGVGWRIHRRNHDPKHTLQADAPAQQLRLPDGRSWHWKQIRSFSAETEPSLYMGDELRQVVRLHLSDDANHELFTCSSREQAEKVAAWLHRATDTIAKQPG